MATSPGYDCNSNEWRSDLVVGVGEREQPDNLNARRGEQAAPAARASAPVHPTALPPSRLSKAVFSSLPPAIPWGLLRDLISLSAPTPTQEMFWVRPAEKRQKRAHLTQNGQPSSSSSAWVLSCAFAGCRPGSRCRGMQRVLPCTSCGKAWSTRPAIWRHPEGERQLWGAWAEPVRQGRIHPRGLPRLRYGTGLGAGKIGASRWRGVMPGFWGGSIPQGGWALLASGGSSPEKLHCGPELGHILVIPG